MDALFIAPEMPWIDPLKEAAGFEKLKDNYFASTPEIIRKRGRNPEDVLDQQATWNESLEERGLMPATQGADVSDPSNTNEQDEDNERNRA